MTGIYITFTSTAIANLASVWGNLLCWRPGRWRDCNKCSTRRPSADEQRWSQLFDAMVQGQTRAEEETSRQGASEPASCADPETRRQERDTRMSDEVLPADGFGDTNDTNEVVSNVGSQGQHLAV